MADTEMKTCECFSCGGTFPDIQGPTHAYMKSTPGCWSVFGEILAREYGDASYMEVHRLTVDSYAVQHPGSDDRQSVQSVGLHLIRLCLLLEHGLNPEHANDAMLAAGKQKHSFVWLDPPSSLGSITAADVVRARSVGEHKALVTDWAQCSWEAWSKHHDAIRGWLPPRWA